MPGPLVLVFKLHLTVVALKPVRLVKLLVFPEKILTLKTSSAVLFSAEEGVLQVHLAMNPDGVIMDCLESAQCTRVLVTIVAMSLVC